jgi:long-subunit acyl-CoA synthetase (AMP-forming)
MNPNKEMMGTKVAAGTSWKYTWITVSQAQKTAKQLAAGLLAMDLCPEVVAEGIPWRFLGIQSKNRKEWFLLHLANMYIGATTCALYDTLGE